MSASNSPAALLPPAVPITAEPKSAGPNPAGRATAGWRRVTARAWRPWSGRPRRGDVVCCAALAVTAVYAVAVIPLTPVLIASHPELLELLSGSNSSIVAAGSFSAVTTKGELAVVIAAALPGMMRFDWVIWWAGRRWGHQVVARLAEGRPRAGALADRAERRGPRFVAPAVLLSAFLPVSGAPVYAAAGWVGLPLVPFMILDAIGSATWATLLAAGGYLLGDQGVKIADLVARYALISIALLIVATVAPHLWSARRRRVPPG
jgi:membrane protein DedA with SNARE-associated domain